MEQELYTLPAHLIPPVFSGIRVAKSLVLCVVFCRSLFSFRLYSIGHCIVYPSSINCICLPLWYLQTFRKSNDGIEMK